MKQKYSHRTGRFLTLRSYAAASIVALGALSLTTGTSLLQADSSPPKTAATAVVLAATSSFQDDRPTSKVQSCTTSGCHSSVINKKEMHDPVAQLQCLKCHDYVDPELHLFKLTKPKNSLCTDCHEQSTTDRVIHDPVAKGDCLSCHDPHGSDTKMILRKNTTKGLCLDCHKEDYSKYDFVHGPVAAGACVICHDPHSSSFPKLLTEKTTSLCTSCHDEATPTGPGRRRQHKPIEDGCIVCHDPHASNARFQLSESVPNLCFSCHDGFKEQLDTAAVVHSPVMDEGGCTKCHNPHFSALPKLQREAQPDLCLKCHGKPLKALDGKPLTDMAKLLKDNPNHHGPIREGACTLCHQPHASKEQRLLVKAYPPEFYAPFKIENYALCFTCHLPDLVKDESGTGLTRFRDGDKNLHWVHVNREKGRTCRACHEVHASKRPAHIREAVPFGSKGWMLEINFTKSEYGGTCSSGCHKTRSYSRSTFPENNPVEPPAEPESEPGTGQ